MATLAPGGRITRRQVEAEIARLRRARGATAADGAVTDLVDRVLLGRDAPRRLDRFDRVQLEDVLRVCRASSSLSEAGRALFASRARKKASANDADRLRKYLARFGLDWQTVNASLQ